jgi:hypothetical protein
MKTFSMQSEDIDTLSIHPSLLPTQVADQNRLARPVDEVSGNEYTFDEIHALSADDDSNEWIDDIR